MFLDNFVDNSTNHSKIMHIYYIRNQVYNRVYHTSYKYNVFYNWIYHIYKAEEKKGKINIISVQDSEVSFSNATVIDIHEGELTL